MGFLGERKYGGFQLHTIDKTSHKGRGIDLCLKNPIIGKFMTESSSGIVLNVFYGINDLGIGTDGRRSILSPAASVNLIGIIHPSLDSGFIEFSTD